MMFFYRKDLFEAAHKISPKTFIEYRDLAKSFNSPARAGDISCLKPVDAATLRTAARNTGDFGARLKFHHSRRRSWR